jgi:uncharacterized protein (TIGR02145 family)
VVDFDIEVNDCGCGCRVRTIYKGQPGWITFMCYNLGTSPEVWNKTPEQQAEYGRHSNATERNKVDGDLYQWGRQSDGHEKRGTATVRGRVNLVNGNAPASVANRFIWESGTPYAWYNNSNTSAGRSLWDGNSGDDALPRVKTVYDPCPDGWRVPTRGEWQGILNGNTSNVTINSGSLITGSGNRWQWRGTGSGSNARGGWLVSPNPYAPSGEQVFTLYIPAGGYRSGTNSGAPLQNVQTAHYWTSTAVADNNGRSYYLNIQPTALWPNYTGGRIDGHSVRCIME